MEINRMLTLSTAHIKESTNNWLENEPQYLSPLVAYKKDEYSWFIYMSSEIIALTEECEQLPDDLAAILNLARENNCDWMCLDCDGEILEGLPVYDW